MAVKLSNFLFDIIHTWQDINNEMQIIKYEDTAWGTSANHALERLKTNINPKVLSEYTFECVGIIA